MPDPVLGPGDTMNRHRSGKKHKTRYCKHDECHVAGDLKQGKPCVKAGVSRKNAPTPRDEKESYPDTCGW